MRQDKKVVIAFILFGALLVVWFGLLIAPYINDGIIEIINNFSDVINSPFNIRFCKDSIKTILLFLFIYGLAIGIYYSSKKNYRKREEHGSAKWGNASQINKKYKQLPLSENKILTQNVKLGLNAKKHRRNLNILVCGGSGAGKTRFFGKPNIMQCSNNTSYVILDPKRRNFKRYRNFA